MDHFLISDFHPLSTPSKAVRKTTFSNSPSTPHSGFYVDVPQSQAGAVASRIQNCLDDVANWSGARRLQLNPG